MDKRADDELLSVYDNIVNNNKRRTEILTGGNIQADSHQDHELGSIGASIAAAVQLLIGIAAITVQGLAAKAAVYKMWEDDTLAASIIDDVLTVCSAKALELV